MYSRLCGKLMCIDGLERPLGRRKVGHRCVKVIWTYPRFHGHLCVIIGTHCPLKMVATLYDTIRARGPETEQFVLQAQT